MVTQAPPSVTISRSEPPGRRRRPPPSATFVGAPARFPPRRRPRFNPRPTALARTPPRSAVAATPAARSPVSQGQIAQPRAGQASNRCAQLIVSPVPAPRMPNPTPPPRMPPARAARPYTAPVGAKLRHLCAGLRRRQQLERRACGSGRAPAGQDRCPGRRGAGDRLRAGATASRSPPIPAAIPNPRQRHRPRQRHHETRRDSCRATTPRSGHRRSDISHSMSATEVQRRAATPPDAGDRRGELSRGGRRAEYGHRRARGRGARGRCGRSRSGGPRPGLRA